MIATPSNPTGTSIPYAELVAICDLARSRDAWRIVDEIYLDLSDPAADGTAPRSVLSVDPDAIVINSFSKYFGMTGWRLGWAVLPEALVPSVERLAMHYFLCASAPAQLAALAAFTPESLAVCEERRAELVARRELVLDGLERIGLPVPAPPDGAFYVYFDISGTGLGAWEFCERALEQAHVVAHPGPGLRRTLRRHPRAPVLRTRPGRAPRRARTPRHLRHLAALRVTSALARFAPPLLLMGVIFALSAQPNLGTGLGVWDTILRKGAHMTEFALLCWLWWRAFGQRRLPLAAAITLAYAATDELHQHFVTGRHASVLDWLIDAAGVAVAVALIVRR